MPVPGPHKTPAPEIRVQIGIISNLDSLQFKGAYTLNAPEARYELNRADGFYLRPDKKGYRLYNKYRLFLLRNDDRLSFSPASKDALFFYRNKAYHGRLMLMVNAQGAILLINKLALDTYLRSVVPSEIFTHNPQDLAAIKAQAVCARSYALQKMSERRKKSFDVYGDTRDQAYGGARVESALGNRAVAETRGSVLMYRGKIAKIYFHACDGGISEAPENIWPGIKAPYLQPRQDVWADSFACRNAPVFRWKRTFNMDQMDSLFNRTYHFSFKDSTVKDTTKIPFVITIQNRTASGRVQKLNIRYGSQSRALEGFAIRRFFGDPKGKALPSTLFKITSNDSLITISGGGYGHGVGLCQYGALYKAEKGLKFYHILQTYFPGTNLEKIY